jgi:YjbE family integral membrane protein
MSNWAIWIESLGTLGTVLQIIGINIVLSGDNAVVIALACRGLPDNRKRMGMVLGAGVAIGLRLIFIFIVQQLLAVPLLKFAGALLLFWIAVKLLTEEEGDAHSKIGATDQLWHAIRTIAIADVVMSFDNVIAVVAAAKGSFWLIVFGIGISVPLIIFGATLVMWLIERSRSSSGSARRCWDGSRARCWLTTASSCNGLQATQASSPPCRSPLKILLG